MDQDSARGQPAAPSGRQNSLLLYRPFEMVLKALAPGARRASLVALAVYLTISVVFFGVPTLSNLSSGLIADGASPKGVADATQMMWFLVWWPHAIFSGLNPFLTNIVWAPYGVNLNWTTSIPAVSLLLSPITFTLGPVIAYNVASLLAPAASAWTAYILCRHISERFWPSLVGGYVFGFSTYEADHLPGHLSLDVVFVVPLLVYLVVLRLDDEIRPRTFVLLLGLALILQFLISSEVFATTTVFGLMALLVALLVFPAGIRKRVLSTFPLIACAYGWAALALSPCLYYTFAPGFPRTPLADPVIHSADLLNFVIPNGLTFFGRHQCAGIANLYRGEQTAYLGLPLVLIVLNFLCGHWRKPLGKLLIVTLGVICLATLGPVLHIAGVPVIHLPWRVALSLPVINHALPSRVTLYVFLVVAIILSLWLNSVESNNWAKAVLLPLSILFLFPNIPDSYTKPVSFWKAKLNTPTFFANRLYKHYLCPGETIVILPYGDQGESMHWQAVSGMSFRMAGGYVNASIPLEAWNSPAVQTFYAGKISSPDEAAHVKDFLSANRITTIIVAQESQDSWREAFSSFGLVSTTVGGVTLYQVSNRPCTP